MKLLLKGQISQWKNRKGIQQNNLKIETFMVANYIIKLITD